MIEGPVTFSSHLHGTAARNNQAGGKPPRTAPPDISDAHLMVAPASPVPAPPPAPPRRMTALRRWRYGFERSTPVRAVTVLAFVALFAAGAVWSTRQPWWTPAPLASLPQPGPVTDWLKAPDMRVLPGLPAQWNPFAPLGLDDPDTFLTRWKIWRIEGSPQVCEQWMQGVPNTRQSPVPDHQEDSTSLCGWTTANRISRLDGIAFSSPFTLSCGASVALARWQHQIVQPAAMAHLGSPVVGIEHLGSYACRGIGGGSRDKLSEHATANALDVSAFELADGRRISVLNDWQKIAEGHLIEFQPPPPSVLAAEGDASQDEQQRAINSATPDETDGKPAAVFLRAVRDGACLSFNAVLGPSYNAAHRDHFHLDRGTHRVCK